MSAPHDPYAPLRHPNYLYFTAGRGIFMLGVQMQVVTVGWLIYQRMHQQAHAAAIALGLVGLAQVAPIVLLALPAGHAADRYDRKHLAMLGQLGIGLGTMGVFLTTHFQGPVWCYYVALFVAAIGRAFNIPSVSALILQLVPKSVLPEAMAWNSTAFQISATLGPALGGLFVARFSGETACLINVLFMGAGYILFSRLRPSTRPAAARQPATLNSLLSGVRFVVRTRLLFAMLLLDLFATLLGGATALLPIYSHDILHTNAAGFGILRAAMPVGAVLTALWVVHRPGWQALLWAVAGYGSATLVFGISTSFWLSVFALALVGAFDNVSVVVRQTVDQMLTPPEMRGRVASFSFIFVSCSNELGEVESGLTAAWLGPVGSVLLGGIGSLLIVAGAVWAFPELLRLGCLRELQPQRVEDKTSERLEELSV